MSEQNTPKNELSNEELETITDTLSENKPKEVIDLSEAREKASTSNEELEEGTTLISVDPKTGKRETLLCEDKEEYNINKDAALEDIDPEDDTFKQAVLNTSKESNISDTTAYQLLDLMLRIKKGEHITNLYAKLPDELKVGIDKMYNSDCGATKNQLAEIILHEFMSESALEKEIIDFQTAMQNTLNIPDILDMYTEHIKDVMEVKTLESANRLEEGGEVDKANLLRKVSATFTDSYTYKSLLEFLVSNRKARNRITKDLPDYNTFCYNFNNMNSKSRFAINDVSQVAPVLERVIDDTSITPNDIKKFVILFCKQCDNYNPDGVVEAAYMYYFIKNIVTLDYIEELKTDFSKEIRSNIIETIHTIKKYEDDNNERLATIKNK